MDAFQEPAPIVPPPPPPPPARSRRSLWIGIAAGVIVLCVCCVAVAIGLYSFRDQIPAIGELFPTATPPGQSYSNPGAGFSLWYPNGWVTEEDGDPNTGYLIFLASSQQVMDSSDETPQNGTWLAVVAKLFYTTDLPAGIRPSEPIAVFNYVKDEFFTDITQVEAPFTWTLDSYPAVSGIYQTDGTDGEPAEIYLTTVIHGTDITVLLAICDDTVWSQYRAPLETIIHSVTFLP